jgi:hypothetical protein
MDFSYSIDTAKGLARVEVSGDVSVEQAAEVIATVSRDPRWQPGFSRLVDMRNARISFSKDGSRNLAAVNASEGRAAAIKPQHKVALVITDELSFGIASQYAAYSELQGVPTEVFRDIARAESWLAQSADAKIKT